MDDQYNQQQPGQTYQPGQQVQPQPVQTPVPQQPTSTVQPTNAPPTTPPAAAAPIPQAPQTPQTPTYPQQAPLQQSYVNPADLALAQSSASQALPFVSLLKKYSPFLLVGLVLVVLASFIYSIAANNSLSLVQNGDPYSTFTVSTPEGWSTQLNENSEALWLTATPPNEEDEATFVSTTLNFEVSSPLQYDSLIQTANARATSLASNDQGEPQITNLSIENYFIEDNEAHHISYTEPGGAANGSNLEHQFVYLFLNDATLIVEAVHTDQYSALGDSVNEVVRSFERIQ